MVLGFLGVACPRAPMSDHSGWRAASACFGAKLRGVPSAPARHEPFHEPSAKLSLAGVSVLTPASGIGSSQLAGAAQ